MVQICNYFDALGPNIPPEEVLRFYDYFSDAWPMKYWMMGEVAFYYSKDDGLSVTCQIRPEHSTRDSLMSTEVIPYGTIHSWKDHIENFARDVASMMFNSLVKVSLKENNGN